MPTRTIVFCHAHPDDEALLTAGTMARAAAAGHRVVLVTATSGEAGLADEASSGDLGVRREAELRQSARILGVARLELLGYPDSGLTGWGGGAGPLPLAAVPPGDVAEHLLRVITEESADVLVGYDAAGGYGHPDHVAVHRAVTVAGRLRPDIAVFEATAPRWPFATAARIAGRLRLAPPDVLAPFRTAFTPSRSITHRVDVRDFCDFKRAALQAHASQATGADVRTLGALLQLPRPVFRTLLGTEFFCRTQ